MPTLTAVRMDEIREVLDKSFFTAAGYDIQYFPQSADKIVQISLKDTPKCVFLMEKRNSTTGTWVVTEIPGDILETERTQSDSFSLCLRSLNSWTSRIRNKVLFANVMLREMEAFQEKLNEELDEKFKDASSKFSELELEEIRRKLSEFQERLSALEAEKGLTKTQAAEAASVVDDLNNAAAVLPKRAWYRTASSRLYQLSKKAAESKVGQQAIASSVKMLLDGGVHLGEISKHL